MKENVIKYVASSIIGIGLILLICFALIAGKDSFINADGEVYMTPLLATINSTFTIGVIYVCIGLLIFSTNKGVFDMLGYGMLLLFNLFRKDVNNRKYKTFYDYHLARIGKQTSFAYLLIIGGAFTTVSLILLIPYYF